MLDFSVRRRARSAIAVAAVGGVAFAGTALLAPGASSAAVAGDCATPYPADALTSGQPVSGLTVSKGTTPEGFSGEVLGVIDDGIALDQDMIVVRLTSAEIDRVGGIWSGMSGSPVYAEDGRLIGAVAYGLAWGPSPVAGVTPFEDMDDYMAPATARRVDVTATQARRIAAATEVTQDQAEQGFSRLRMPLTVKGVNPARLKAVDERFYRTYRLQSGQAGGTSDATAADIVAGGNLAASLSYGDITAGAVGTVTSVCNDQVVGFGHPFTFTGATTLGMNPASAIYIQEDSLGAPFKVANFAPPVGTIDEDRGAGVAGALGPVPAATELSSTVRFGERSRTGTTDVYLPDFGPQATLVQILANQDRVFDAITGGGAEQTWTIKGTGPDGAAFTLNDGDRYASPFDISSETPLDVADTVWALSSIDGVTLDSIAVDGTLTENEAVWSLRRVERYQAGRWTRVRSEMTVTAGQKLRLRAVLSDGTRTSTQNWTYTVPRRLRDGWASLEVVGGYSDWGYEDEFEEGPVDQPTLGEVLADARNGQRNDELRWSFAGRGAGGRVSTNQLSAPRKLPIQGQRYVDVMVR
ncbi:hypothetical protein K8W59_08200 [Nocardioides rotundus]|uniref:SpoIVB peptidase S55 domain-containing protein n=1 Tax=Nocardioides rotundus TaxID=1774216 RepID=UPI001CC13D3B|nr:SpoIVB peptidase S55 domain-containing protein [Nocardioides rotundus]UAL31410.1 hypothetical protein K8W59_08200 [Nocardioides rotundus]